MIEPSPVPLTGKALLQKMKECAHLPKREQARICGYYSKNRVRLVEFYEASVAARGIVLNPEQSRERRGREPTHRVTVHKNGQIVIGATYTQAMGLNPGDEFEIKLGYKHIHLRQISSNGHSDGNGKAEQESGKKEGEQKSEA
ncbi:MAG: AbrB family transcriptional regulator [Pseudanabaenaceae cyanobacterium]